MEDPHAFRLLLELEENNHPKLKLKLVKYFNSKKSNGGDCEVDYENGSKTAVLRFRTEKELQNVLEKKDHQIDLPEGALKLKLSLLPDDVTSTDSVGATGSTEAGQGFGEPEKNDEEPSGELRSMAVAIENVPECLKQELMQMLVENILNDSNTSSSTKFKLEIIPEKSAAVVTFQNAKDTSIFIQKCPAHKVFIKNGLSARELEVTRQILVEGVQTMSEYFLHLYFEKEMGDVDTVTINEEEDTALITFINPKVVQEPFTKRHNVKKNKLEVYPFYESLGTALYGEKRPVMKLPALILELIDHKVLKYLNVEKAAAAALHKDLDELFCRVELRESAVCLRPLPSLIKQRDAKKRIQSWDDEVKSALERSLSRFKCLTFQPGPDCMEDTTKVFQEMLPKNVLVIPVKETSELTVVGWRDDVEKQSQMLTDKVSDLVTSAHRKKMSVTQQVNVSQSILNILYQHGLQNKLLSIHPDLKLILNKDKTAVEVTGLKAEVIRARDAIYGEINNLKRKNVELDEILLEFLKGEAQEKITELLFTRNGVNAAILIDAGKVQVTAMSDIVLNEADHHLRKLLVVVIIDLEEKEIVRLPEWDQLVQQLENDHKELSKKMYIETKEDEVVIFGLESGVTSVCSKLQDFIDRNSHLEEVIPVKCSIVVKYLLEHKKARLKNVSDIVKVSPVTGGIHVSGSRENVENCSTVIKELVSNVCFDEFKFDKPGMMKFLKDEENVYVPKLMKDTGCLVELIQVPETEAAEKLISSKTFKHMKAHVPEQVPVHLRTPSPLKTVSNDPNCLGQTVTDEGVAITLMKGNIQEAETDVVVCSLSLDLDLSKGQISKALSDAAGPSLQPLVTAKKRALIGDVFETEGCQLKSEKILHAVCPHWDNAAGEADRLMCGIIKKCLDMTEASGCTSISFPALGAGKLGFPKGLCASLLYQEILKYSTNRGSTNLKQVTIVFYPKDYQTIQDFVDEFQKTFSSSLSGTSTLPRKAGSLSRIVSTNGVHEAHFGSVTLQLVVGDITKETTDVIVNSSNKDFNLKTGVSKAILEAAGPAVETDCQTLGTQPNPGIIMTKPGNLKSKKILHLEGQTSPVKVKAVVKDALEVCLKDAYKSVSFPAIGTGRGGVEARQVADAMLDAVIDRLSTEKPSSLETIRIVIFQTPMLKDFYESMHNRGAPQANKRKSIFTRLKSFFTSSRSPEEEEEQIDIVGINGNPVSFHVCGDTVTEVASAKQWMDKYITDNHATISITDDNIMLFSESDNEHINDIQKTMSLCIRKRQNNGRASLKVEGPYKQVYQAGQPINEILNNIKEKEKRVVELASKVADWRYQVEGQDFISFDRITNYTLEHALECKTANLRVTIEGQDYTVTMPGGPATDNQGQTLQIKRILKLEGVPEYWDSMPANSTCQIIPLEAATPEYIEVLKSFQATCNQTVLKIERIQNPALWQSLEIKKKDMQQRNGHQNNERRLFHGTTSESVAFINEEGFNRSYAGRNAARFGDGVYMAVSAKYSANEIYSKPDVNGERFMYICRVLTGDYTLGVKQMKVPPTKPNSTNKYDSVVNDLQQPGMFVIFHDCQAYPEYLITFK